MHAKELLQRFGTYGAIADIVGAHRRSVGYWVKTNLIPAHHQRTLLAYAKLHRIPLTPEDFFTAPTKYVPPEKCFRDELAIAALQGMLHGRKEELDEGRVRLAYAYADAMLEIREEMIESPEEQKPRVPGGAK